MYAELKLKTGTMAEDRDIGAMLPDELWVHVFSHLDGHLLLDVVPLVCKRWRRLAGDSRSWASVCVRGCVDRVDQKVQEMARVILHAPGLRCLDLQCTGRHTRYKDMKWPEDHRLVSALRRCRAVVFHEVRVSDYTWLNMPASARKAVAELVQRSAPHLRRVHLTLSEQDREERPTLDIDEETMMEDEIEAVLDAQPDPLIPLLDSVARLKRLELLHLDVDLNDKNELYHDNPPYEGELSAVSLPRLREIVLRDKFGAVPTLLIVDLLRAAAPTLKVVKIAGTIEDWSAAKNPDLPAVVEELCRCTGLRTLHIDDSCLPALGSLPRLKSLGLYVYCAKERGETVRRVEAALAACQALDSLRKLYFVLKYLDVVEGEQNQETVRRKFESLLDRFARRRLDLRVSHDVDEGDGCWSPCEWMPPTNSYFADDFNE